MATYSVCETVENNGDKYFTVVPTNWTTKNMFTEIHETEHVFGLSGEDCMLYSDKKKSSVRNLMNKAKRDPNTPPMDVLDKWRCTIIRDDFDCYKSVCIFNSIQYNFILTHIYFV